MKKFTEDKFVILFKSNDYGDNSILHNLYFKDVDYNSVPIEPESKRAKISEYRYSCIGYFNSIDEAKTYIYQNRAKYLENIIKTKMSQDVCEDYINTVVKM